ncbi:MAG: YceI family protein [Dehalococcoidia bacterium]|nr:YceI family protein [Dehalococcoidia bacterium]
MTLLEGYQPMTWQLDPTHSSIQFGVKHMLVATTRGTFREYDVDATIDEANPAASQAVVTIRAASIDTGEANRDGHLKSADFFDAETYPEIVFRSKRIEPKGSDVRLIGDLTVKGVTKEVALEGEWSAPQQDPFGGTRAGISVEGKVNRKDFGLTWTAPVELGGIVVGDTVKLSVDVELVKGA